MPAMFPMLKTAPPRKTSAASTTPAPGSTFPANSCARRPEIPMTRHTFSCTAMSTRIEIRMANAKAAPSCTVKTVVWVMKPGPMALVAMRNMAPNRALRCPVERWGVFPPSVTDSPGCGLGLAEDMLPSKGSRERGHIRAMKAAYRLFNNLPSELSDN